MIIIIGDGIAGFAFASHLDKYNIDYILLSKSKKYINSYDNSYGITIQEGNNILNFLNIKFKNNEYNKLLRYIKIDKDTNILGYNYHLNDNYVVSRQILLDKLIEKTNKNKIIKYDSLIICDKYIIVDSQIYKYDLLIGADGINSDVRKYLNVNDVVENTGYKFRIYKFIDSFFKNITNDCVEYIDSYNKIRIFIKPNLINGINNTTAQVYYPQNSDNILRNLPEFISHNINSNNYYESNLNTTKKFDAPIGTIILLGDAYNAMTPYNGNGANTALINAHHLANIIKLNLKKLYY